MSVAVVEQAVSRRGLGRPFAAQLASTGLANLGDGILVVLAPLLALTLTTSPLEISLLSAATWLPWLLFGIVAGVVVDRVDRRRLQIVALIARAVLLAGATVLAATGGLTMTALVLVVLVYGLTEVFADLGATSIVPDLVSIEQLPAANGRILGVQQVANSFLGAPLAGLLVVIGAAWGLGATAGLVALAALALVVGLRGSFRRVDPDADPTTSRGVTAAMTQVRQGLSFLVRHRILGPLTLASALLNMASAAYFAVFVVWVVGPASAVGLSETGYALLMVGFALGAVAGSLLASPLQARFGENRTMLSTLVINSLLLVVPVLVPNGWVIAATLLVVGLLNTVGNVLMSSLKQRLVPGHLLGRVSGAGRALSYGLMPVGAMAGGLIAHRSGLPTTFVAAAVVSVLACGLLTVRLRKVTL